MINRLHLFAVITALAGMAALAAMALNWPFLLSYGCLCLVTLAGFVLVASLQKQRSMLERSGASLGQFMRGQWGARLQPDSSDDEFSRLQHRINNMLDAIDLHLHGEAAAIDLTEHADYAEKLKFTALYESLEQHQKSLEEIKAERSPTQSVGVLLNQLGHNVADLFKSEPAPPPPSNINRESQAKQLRNLRDVAARLQASTTQLAERAMGVKQAAPVTPPLSAATLDRLMARIAEQATVISLNVAIEAARAPSGSTLGNMGEELHAIATQLHKTRADMAALLASAVPAAQTVPSVPLSFAVEALTTAEASLRAQIDAVEAELDKPGEGLEEAA